MYVFLIIIHPFIDCYLSIYLSIYPAKDISRFLSSRYGIVVTEAEVSKTIFDGFAGGSGDDDDDDVLDLMEIASIVMIPYLLKAAYEVDAAETTASNAKRHLSRVSTSTISRRAPCSYKAETTSECCEQPKDDTAEQSIMISTTITMPADDVSFSRQKSSEKSSGVGITTTHNEGETSTATRILSFRSDVKGLPNNLEQDSGGAVEETTTTQLDGSQPQPSGGLRANDNHNQSGTFSRRDLSRGASKRLMKRRYRTDNKSRDDFSSGWEYEEFLHKCHISEELSPTQAPEVIQGVLSMILYDTSLNMNTSSKNEQERNNEEMAPELTVDLLESIFAHYGEYEIANDKKLLSEMVETTRNVTPPPGDDAEDTASNRQKAPTSPLFDAATFMRGLTSDIKLYDIDNELKGQTFYCDVFQTEQSTKKSSWHESLWYFMHGSKEFPAKVEMNKTEAANKDWSVEDRPQVMEEGRRDNHEDAGFYDVTRIFTCPSIDFFADAYRSVKIVVLLWIGYVFAYYCFFYEAGGQDFEAITCPDFNDFGCTLSQSILRWLIAGATLRYV
jgi:hypothetical protein